MCLQLVKCASEGIISYGGNVNRACEDSQFQNLTPDHFKRLIVVSGFKTTKYADVRARLLFLLENVQSLIDENQRIVNLKKRRHDHRATKQRLKIYSSRRQGHGECIVSAKFFEAGR